MHTNYYKIIELLKSLKIIILANTGNFIYRSQHRNFGEAQAESSIMMVYVNRNMLEQLL